MAEKRRRKGTGSIKELPDGSYLVRMKRGKKPNGKPNEKSRKAYSKRDAQRKLKEIEEEFKREEQFYQNIENTDFTTKEYFDVFLNYKRATLGDTSFRRLESTIEHHIIKQLGDYLFCELNSDVIQQRISDAMQQGLSYSSVKKIYEAFTGCYRYAISRGNILTDKNPMNAVTMPSKSKFQCQRLRARYLHNNDENDERARFTQEALRKYKNGKYVYRYGPAMIFMMNTGIRESEMSALKHDHIDYTQRYMSVQDSAVSVKKNGHYTIDIRKNVTKWDSGRYVALNDTAMDMLRIMQEQFGSDGLVIKTVYDTVLPPLEFTKTFHRICDAANITDDMKGVGAHCLRHTFASALLEYGVDLKTISELLGHKNISITADTYLSVSQKMKAKAVQLPNIS